MSDYSTGSADRDEDHPERPVPADDEPFAPETAGPYIDAPPLPPPPPPSVTEVGVPDAASPYGEESDDDALPPEPERSSVPDPYAPEPSVPEPYTPDPYAPEPSVPEPYTPDPYAPEPSVPEPYAPEPLTPEPPALSEQDESIPEPPSASEVPGAEDVPWQVPNPTPPWSSQENAFAPAAPPPPPPPPVPVPAPAPAPQVVPAPPPAPAPAAPAPQVAPGPVPAYGAPQAPGYPQQAAGYPSAQMPPQMIPQVLDPHGVGMAVNWLGGGSKRAGRTVFPLLAAVLEEGDMVDILVQGRVRGEPGLAALVGTKLVLVNARLWKPDVITMPVTETLQVQGMRQGNLATLVLLDGDRQEVVEQIGDAQLAVPMAEQIRMRVAALGGGQPGQPGQMSGEFPAAPGPPPPAPPMPPAPPHPGL